MKSIRAIKRGIAAALAGPVPRKYSTGGKVIVCSHCESDQFVPYDLTKFGSEGLLRVQFCLECTTCSHVEIFTKPPIEVKSPR